MMGAVTRLPRVVRVVGRGVGWVVVEPCLLLAPNPLAASRDMGATVVAS